MLTRDAFQEHKKDYTIFRKTAGTDRYGNEQNSFAPGGSVKVMWTPIADEASIQTYGERVNTMMQAAIYEDTEISEHDQVEINGARCEIVSIRQYPSYRLAQVQKI